MIVKLIREIFAEWGASQSHFVCFWSETCKLHCLHMQVVPGRNPGLTQQGALCTDLYPSLDLLLFRKLVPISRRRLQKLLQVRWKRSWVLTFLCSRSKNIHVYVPLSGNFLWTPWNFSWLSFQWSLNLIEPWRVLWFVQAPCCSFASSQFSQQNFYRSIFIVLLIKNILLSF